MEGASSVIVNVGAEAQRQWRMCGWARGGSARTWLSAAIRWRGEHRHLIQRMEARTPQGRGPVTCSYVNHHHSHIHNHQTRP